MATILKPAQSEHFMVDIFEVTPEEVQMCRLRDAFNGRGEYYGFEPGAYARLSHRVNGGRGATMMSDTWMEQRSNMEFCNQAKGDVLVAGLGIGMVLLAVQANPEVDRIVVVEKEQEVIDLVEPQLPLNKKVIIVNDDIFEYHPQHKFDTIYFDIWDGISADNLPDMRRLHRKASKWRKEGGWVGSWRREECRRLK
jgi:hypothetical protein